MAAKKDNKLFKQLLCELLYNGINIVYAHGQFKVYHLWYLRKSTSSITFYKNYIFISLLVKGKKLESIMIFLISTQIFVTITSSLLQHPFLLEALECT